MLQHGIALTKIYCFQILVHSRMASSHSGLSEIQGLQGVRNKECLSEL